MSFQNYMKTVISGIKAWVKDAIVQSDWNQNDETNPAYVKNRTHYKEVQVVSEPLNITWDGNTEGLVSAGSGYYKVSDIVLTDEQIQGCKVTDPEGTQYTVSEIWQYVTVSETAVISELFAVVREENAQIYNIVFPETGIYLVGTESSFVSALTSEEPIEFIQEKIVKIPSEFIPWEDARTTRFYVYEHEDGTKELMDKSGNTIPYEQVIAAGLNIEIVNSDGSFSRPVECYDNGRYVKYYCIDLSADTFKTNAYYAGVEDN